MIEMIEVTQIKKLNYLIKIYKIIKTDKNHFHKEYINILFNYLKLCNDIHFLVNKRINLIINHFNKINKKCFVYNFYDIMLFNKSLLDIKKAYQDQEYYLNIIIKKWSIFNKIINHFISIYL
tara:strand:+ start:815 stop:1180 length:366 start_codon:yes stop_codon:yes gene_type:complete